MLTADPPTANDRDHAVRFGFGAGVDGKLQAPFEQRFGFLLIEAWAMTETGAGAMIAASDEPRHVGTCCFGRPGPEVECRIVQEDGSNAEQSELLVRHAGPDRGFGFFRAYLKDAAATAEAWTDGWFQTGDVVRRGPDGSLHFVDRRKNIMRRSGQNIAAVEVESALRQHHRVAAADPHQHRYLLPRTHALAHRHRRPGLRPITGCSPVWRCHRGRPGPYDIASRQKRQRGGAGNAGAANRA